MTHREIALTETEREAIWASGDHEPNLCDCTADIMEQAFAEDCCCEGLLLTFEAVEMVVTARLIEAEAALLRELESQMLKRIGARMVSNDYMDLMFAVRARAEEAETSGQRNRDVPNIANRTVPVEAWDETHPDHLEWVANNQGICPIKCEIHSPRTGGGATP